MAVRAWLALAVVPLLAGAVVGSDTAGAPQESRFQRQWRSLTFGDKVEAHGLLSEWSALVRAADAVQHQPDALRAVEDLLRHTQHRLFAAAPQLQGFIDSTEGLAALQRGAAQALIVDLAARPSLQSPRSRLSRALTLVNICWFCGCMLLLVAAGTLVDTYLAALVRLVPLPAWEAAGYGASVWVLHRATHCSPATAPYVGLTGLLMFTACAGGSIAAHLANWFNKSEQAGAALMGFFAALYGTMAVRLQATLLGTISVWWAMSALGFAIATFPFLTVIGFNDGMARPFAAALALILALLPFKAVPATLPMPPVLQPFETGVWLWCPLVLNVANLILAHQAWERAGRTPTQHPRLRRLGSQLLPVAVIGGTLACGILLDVEQCRAVGAVFGFLWMLSKLAEWDWRRVGFAWAALAFGSALWAFAFAVHTWPHVFKLGSMAAA